MHAGDAEADCQYELKVLSKKAKIRDGKIKTVVLYMVDNAAPGVQPVCSWELDSDSSSWLATPFTSMHTTLLRLISGYIGLQTYKT